MAETADSIEVSLFVISPSELKTKFTIPTETTVDVSLRRLQKLNVAPGAIVRWTFKAASGEAQADSTGCVTIANLNITSEPTVLTIQNR